MYKVLCQDICYQAAMAGKVDNKVKLQTSGCVRTNKLYLYLNLSASESKFINCADRSNFWS